LIKYIKNIKYIKLLNKKILDNIIKYIMSTDELNYKILDELLIPETSEKLIENISIAKDELFTEDELIEANVNQRPDTTKLIYPKINDASKYLNVLLIEDTVPNYQLFVDSVNSQTFPIVYSTNSSRLELLDFLNSNFSQICRLAFCFTISTFGDVNQFLDNEPLFLDNEVEPNVINYSVNKVYSLNVQFMLHLISNFNILNIDFLGCNSLKYQNWLFYYELLKFKSNVLIGASENETGNIIYGGDWTMENTNKNIEYIYFKKSIEYYMHLLDVSNAFKIISGKYLKTTYELNSESYTVLRFTINESNNVAKLKSNYDNLSVNAILVGGGGSGNNDGGGGGGGGIQKYTFKTKKSTELIITIGKGGEASSTSSTGGNDGEDTTIEYNAETYTASGGTQGVAGEYLSVEEEGFADYLIGGYGGASGATDSTGGSGGNEETDPLYGSSGTNGGGGGQGVGENSITDGDNTEFYNVEGGSGSLQTGAFETDTVEYALYGGSSPYFGAGGGGPSGRVTNTTENAYTDYLGAGGNGYAGSGTICGDSPFVWQNATSATSGYGGGGGGSTNGGSQGYDYGSAGSGGSGTVILYFITPTSTTIKEEVTISNICFPEDTPVLTDQGIISIQNIDTNVNTIDNKKIVAITKSISQDNYLVCFKKHCLGYNYPSNDTVMTKEHKIKYDKQMVEADNFLGYIDNVVKVGYNGEVLYNVLMDKYEKINVNNLICETLHPQNKIAKIYNSEFSEDYKKRLIEWTNKTAIKDANDKMFEYENEKIMLKKLEKIINITKQHNLTKYNSWQNAFIESKLKNYIKNKEIDEKTQDELIKKKEKMNNEKIKKYYEECNEYNEYNENKKCKETTNAHRCTQKHHKYKIKLKPKSVTYKK